MTADTASPPADGGETSLETLLNEIGALMDRSELEAADVLARQVGREFAPVLYALATLELARGDARGAVHLFQATEYVGLPTAECSIGSARALLEIGDLPGSRQHALRALDLDPELDSGRELLGQIHLRCWEYGDAVRVFEPLVERHPSRADLWNGLGIARLHAGDAAGAADAFRAALGLGDAQPEPWMNLGVALRALGEGEEGLAAMRRAMALAPRHIPNGSAYLLALNESDSATTEEIAVEHRRWGDYISGTVTGETVLHTNVPEPARRLRVGYVSADFRAHSVAFFVAPILALHDHSVVEVHCYSNHPSGDSVTAQLRRNADHWVEASGMSDDTLAAKIRADRIDILVDLSGHTAGSRLGVFARKPAPVQVTYLGYPNTTGLGSVDFRISDAWADPIGLTEPLHTERLLRLSETFLCYVPLAGGPEVAAPPMSVGLTPTFGCFNRGRKFNASLLLAWSRILAEVPSARLLLKPGPVDRAVLLRQMSGVGITAERVAFLAFDADVRNHLEHYSHVDVALDTFPYSGTTTTCEAMWMGVPVVTLAGADHRSRVGASLLRHGGLRDCVTSSEEEYVARAIALVSDPIELRRRRLEQRAQMEQSPLMDPRRFVQDLELRYRDAWMEWCARGKPS